MLASARGGIRQVGCVPRRTRPSQDPPGADSSFFLSDKNKGPHCSFTPLYRE